MGGSAREAEAKLFAGDDKYSFTYPCSQIFNNVYVTSEGYLVICCQDFENLTVVADLHEEDVVSAWNNKKFTAFRKKYLAHDLQGTLCANCLGITEDSKVVPLTPEKAYYRIDPTKEKNMNLRIEQLAEQLG